MDRNRRFTVESLEALIGTEELLGVIESKDSGAVFPDGSAMAICTNCARRVVEILGRGVVWGYSVLDNPDTKAADGCGGHDFAIIDDRFIVDVWISLFVGEYHRSVFDFEDPGNAAVIVELYGNRTTWTRLDA